MRWWTSGLLTFLVASASAQAQGVLSDNELFASYCIGHFKRVLQETQDVQRSTGPCVEVKGAKVSCREMDDLWRKAFEEIRANQLRLRRYLIARGILTIRSEVPVLAGLAAATNRHRISIRR
jgi:uncharacterized protein involved in propanediol utilization